LLIVVLPLKSFASTANVYVVARVRCRRTTMRSPYQFTFAVAGAPFTKTRYPSVHQVTSSVERVHSSRTCEGPRTLPLRTGAVGGVVSRSVVTVTVLLGGDSLSALSRAAT
jgi:hypothetical protein